jgi:toxin ParE1/3/4
MKHIRLSRAARADLIEITTYFLEQSEQSLSLARRFLLSFEETARMLAKYPKIGRPVEFLQDRQMRHLAIRRFDRYRIFYEERADAVRIVRVLHGARDLASILGEESSALGHEKE